MCYELKSRPVLVLVAVLWAALAVQAAVAKPLLAPLGGVSLLAPDYPPPPGGRRAYSHTAGRLQWSVGPWSDPAGALPGFVKAGSLYVSQNASSGVQLHAEPGGSWLQLSQNGTLLACEKSGAPREFDLFAFPNGPEVKPPRQPGYFVTARGRALDTMRQLRFKAVISAQSGLAASRKHCRANFANTEIGVVLADPAAHQTLFYQLKLSRLCGNMPDIQLKSCSRMDGQLKYYAAHSPFGVDDELPSLGQPWLRQGVARGIDVDLLPRLDSAIAHGPAGIDRDPSHWRLNAVYFGQAIYGDTQLVSRWQNISLTETP